MLCRASGYSRSIAAGLLLAVCSARSAEIYSGEPLGEALHDLGGCVLISHELATSTPLIRTDVFKLPDGRLLALTSKSSKLGDSYSVEFVRVTPDSKTALTAKTPKVSSMELNILSPHQGDLPRPPR